MAASASPASEGHSLGSLRSAIVALNEEAGLFVDLLNDDRAVSDLAAQAMRLRIEAQRLENTLDSVAASLESLNG